MKAFCFLLQNVPLPSLAAFTCENSLEPKTFLSLVTRPGASIVKLSGTMNYSRGFVTHCRCNLSLLLGKPRNYRSVRHLSTAGYFYSSADYNYQNVFGNLFCKVNRSNCLSIHFEIRCLHENETNLKILR